MASILAPDEVPPSSPRLRCRPHEVRLPRIHMGRTVLPVVRPSTVTSLPMVPVTEVAEARSPKPASRHRQAEPPSTRVGYP